MKIAYIYGSKVPKKEADAVQVINNVSSLKKQNLDITLFVPSTLKNIFFSKIKFTCKVANFYSVDPINLPIRRIFSFPFHIEKISNIFHSFFSVTYIKLLNYNFVYTRCLFTAMISKLFNFDIIFETYKLLNKHNSLFFKFFVKILGNNLKFCITHSELARNDLIKGGVNPLIIKCIYNGFNDNDFNPYLSIEEARKKLNISSKKIITTYSGRIDIEKGLITILNLAKNNKNIDFFLIGNIKKKVLDYINSFTLINKLNNIVLINYLKSKELVEYLYASNFLIIPPSNIALEKGKTVLPLKLFQYLASRRIIIAPNQEDIKEILSHMHNSILIDIDKQDDFSKYTDEFIRNNPTYNLISANAYNTSKKYTWEKRALLIKDFLIS